MGKGFTAVDFGRTGYRDIPATEGTLVRIQNSGLKRQVIYAGPGGDGPRREPDELNLAAGNLHGIVSTATSVNPIAQRLVDWAFDQIGGVDQDSEMFKKGDAIGGGVTAGALLFIAPPTRPDAEYLNLTKQIASEAGVAEILAGEGKAFAGAGTDIVFRDAALVAKEHGGETSEWAKVSSSAFHAADNATIETHAVQNMATGKIVELKSVSSSFPGRH